MPSPIDYTMLNVGGEDLAGVLQITDDMGAVPPHWMVYYGVDDVDAAATKVESPGGSVEVPWRFRRPTSQRSAVSPD